MLEKNLTQDRLSEAEREDARLAKLFTANLPLPRTPSGTDRAEIVHYLDSEPSLTNFRKNGLEKFLSNIGVLPDGRVICTLTGLDDRRPFFAPFVWNTNFGACFCLVIGA